MSKCLKISSAIRLMTFGAAVIVLSACGSSNKERLAYVERPAELICNQALKELDRGDWADAKLLFQEVERQHPFDKWARRSMLMSAYASYRAADHEESIAQAQRFIGLHPGSDSAPYGYYLIAINHYDQIYDVGRDQATTVAAEAALQQVVRRYPDSCLLYTSPSPRDATLSRMPSSA